MKITLLLPLIIVLLATIAIFAFTLTIIPKLGMNLIKLLSKQLKAEIVLFNDKGFGAKLNFKILKNDK